MDLETKEFDSVYESVQHEISALGGWLESNTVSQRGYGENERTAYLTARIPVKKLDEFLSFVDENVKVTRRTESTTDVTLKYTDTEAHIRALETECEKLEEMLEMAESVDELITIHDRLTYVQYELDSARSSLRVLQNQVDCSSVTIALQEVVEYTEPETESFPVCVAKGFMENLRDTFSWLTGLIEWVITHLPGLCVFGVICYALVRFIRLMNRKSKERKEQKEFQNCNNKLNIDN